ncbi:MAG: hypothetical protein IH600_16500 [Bacteroidetes bacterium]|nr:hypothetical protein [Bacteroidota bacterium]
MKILIILYPLFCFASSPCICQTPDATRSPVTWGEAERVAFIRQIGLNNLATILQTGAAEEQTSQAHIVQYLTENRAAIDDHGSDNTVTILQYGMFQDADIKLEGDGNFENILQQGLGNTFLMNSSVDDATGVYSQHGRENMLKINKRDGVSVPVEIHQIGNGIQMIIE